jgi:hypothetical protein
MERGSNASAVHFDTKTPIEKGRTCSREPVSSKRMTARVTDNLVTPVMVAPAATSAYTPGTTHDSGLPLTGQFPKISS